MQVGSSDSIPTYLYLHIWHLRFF